MTAGRGLRAAGLSGAALTAVILATSVLLRLGTRIEAERAVSFLSPGLETAARLAHRGAASMVAILAAIAIVAVARDGEARKAHGATVAWITALVALLAMIGGYTPGYRFDTVTVANVVGGIGLAAAFARLAAPALPGAGTDGVARASFWGLFAVAGLGAATAAGLMRGHEAIVHVHGVAGAALAAACLAAAWRQRAAGAIAATAAVVVLGQGALGAWLAFELPRRILVPAWIHALVPLILAPLLLRLWRRP